MRISVAVTNFNYGRYLAGCIDSVLGQSEPAHEIVVVDDGSSDDSLNVLRKYGDKVTVIATPNRGVAQATNSAVARCSGDVIALLDADDMMCVDRVRRLAEIYEKHPEAGWVWHRLGYVDRGTGEPVSGPGDLLGYSPGPHDHRQDVANGRLPITMPATSALSWRADVLRAIMPMPSPMRSQDNYLKFVSLGLATGVVLDEKLALQGIHGGNSYTTAVGGERRQFQLLAALDMAPGLHSIGLRALERRVVASAVVGSLAGARLQRDDRVRLRRAAAAAGPGLVPWFVVEALREVVRATKP
jgi:hypothetical protein